MSNPAVSFEPYRRRLLGLAYAMVGSMAGAEDAVEETYLRWHGTDRDTVSDPRAFFMTTTTRICLDMLTSARAGCVMSAQGPRPPVTNGFFPSEPLSPVLRTGHMKEAVIESGTTEETGAGTIAGGPRRKRRSNGAAAEATPSLDAGG